MRVDRKKSAKRILQHFNQAYEIIAPYKLLVDTSFLLHALDNGVQIQDSLTKLMMGGVHVYVSSCVVKNLREASKSDFRARGAMILCQKLSTWTCTHEATTSEVCIHRLIGSKNNLKFTLVCQNPNFRKQFESTTGLPMIYVKNGAPVLCRLTVDQMSAKAVQDLEKSRVQDFEADALPEKRKRDLLAAQRQKKALKKKAKGPNPMSCAKKKGKKAKK